MQYPCKDKLKHFMAKLLRFGKIKVTLSRTDSNSDLYMQKKRVGYGQMWNLTQVSADKNEQKQWLLFCFLFKFRPVPL